MNSSTLDARQDRAESLAALDFNGMNHAILQLLPDVLAPTTAELEVFFFNDKHLADFKQANFSVSGGRRVVAGSGMGQVSVRSVTPILALPDGTGMDYNCSQSEVRMGRPAVAETGPP